MVNKKKMDSAERIVIFVIARSAMKNLIIVYGIYGTFCDETNLLGPKASLFRSRRPLESVEEDFRALSLRITNLDVNHLPFLSNEKSICACRTLSCKYTNELDPSRYFQD